MKVLTTPAKVASSLDWRKTVGGAVLTLGIHSDRIDLAVSHHPSSGRGNAHALQSLALGRKGRDIPEASRQRLADVVRQHRVCAYVVSWPVQPDSGKMGYAAGRTLWTIEQLLGDAGGNGVISSKRPVCLWESIHKEQSVTDEWGRNPDFARTATTNTVHSASQEQYHVDENLVLAQVWDDFMQANWPGIYRDVQHNAQDDVCEEEEEEQQQYVFSSSEEYADHDARRSSIQMVA